MRCDEEQGLGEKGARKGTANVKGRDRSGGKAHRCVGCNDDKLGLALAEGFHGGLVAEANGGVTRSDARGAATPRIT